MRRPALIFDFGNVIAFFDYGKTVTKLGAHLGVSGDELFDRLRSLGFTRLHQEFERGQISPVAFTERVRQLVGLTISHDEFVLAWNDIFTVNHSLVPLIEQLKTNGYRLVLGSNTNELQAAFFQQQFASTLAHFDRLILSCEIKHLKPDPNFYLACAQAAEAEPADCVFIDDLPENVEGARAAGLVGVLYQSTEGLIGELNRLGVSVEAAQPGNP